MNRLEKILANLGESTRAFEMQGDGRFNRGKASKLLQEDGVPEVSDALLISAALRVEHYEIAGYGSARAFAELLGENEAAGILKQTLDEETETDQKLTQLAKSAVNPQAQSASADLPKTGSRNTRMSAKCSG